MQANHNISPAVFGIWTDSAALGEDIGVKPDTVYRALARRRLPVHWWPKMIDRAAQRGKLLTADVLLAFNQPPPKLGRRAIRATRRKRSEARAS
jgi:hypothetical protein